MSNEWLEGNLGYTDEGQSLSMEGDLVSFRRLGPNDENAFWMVDFRYPKGVTPLGMTHLELAYGFGASAAAESAPIHTGDGYNIGLVGTYCYTNDRPISDPAVRREREKRLIARVEALPDTFREDWAKTTQELRAESQPFRTVDYSALTKSELATYLDMSRDHMKHMWERHFYWMYPLLALQESFYMLCDQLDVSRFEVAELLGGERSFVSECDENIQTLAEKAKAMGVQSDILTALEQDDPIAALAQDPLLLPWLNQFRTFLDQFGWRADIVGDPSSPSWREHPGTPLSHIAACLRQKPVKTASHTQHGPTEICEAIRGRLSSPERRVFDEALADMRKANFVWWQEDHNPQIDMCAALPLRLVALEIGRRIGLSDPEDVVFHFCKELYDFLNGSLPEAEAKALVSRRATYFQTWKKRRRELPRYFGPLPEEIDDAVYNEIEGLTTDYLASVRGDGDKTKLVGVSASWGVVEGRARVVLDAGRLDQIEDGEILVCEGSTPSWTPVFGRIAACVADQGGTLSHTAIIAREQNVPCVVALGVATQRIKSGDRIRVDADSATVEVLDHA